MRLRSIPIVVTLALGILAPPPAFAEQARTPRMFRIGILTSAYSPWHGTTERFRDGLKEFGYIEGQSVVFEARATQGDLTRVPELVAELLTHRPDLLFCVGDACQRMRVSKQIPVVFTGLSDPVRLGLVKSVARPGGNVTGIANLRAELTAKRLELFREIVPSLRRVLVTYDPREAEEREAVGVARSAASRLGLTLLERAITAPLEIEPALADLKEGGQDGILMVQSGANLNIPGRSLEVATSNKLPTMYSDPFWSRVGALASYGPDESLQGRQAARLAHKILKGTPPGEIPVEFPDRLELVVNLKTAKRLGLSVPREMVLRADRVIE